MFYVEIVHPVDGPLSLACNTQLQVEKVVGFLCNDLGKSVFLSVRHSESESETTLPGVPRTPHPLLWILWRTAQKVNISALDPLMRQIAEQMLSGLSERSGIDIPTEFPPNE